jgi:hypothetical protein
MRSVRRRRLREPFIYFVDEYLGRHVVPDALRQAVREGERVQVLPQGTLDLDWIPLAHRGGWACLTKDHALRRRPNELLALLAAGLEVVHPRRGVNEPSACYLELTR